MSEIEEKLGACPFCGTAPQTIGAGEGQRGLMIECMTHGCVGPHVSYYDHAGAIAAWNRRTPDPALAAALADARRYRWLRDKCDTTTGFLLAQRLEADEWDAAIDALLSGEEVGNG